MRVRVGKRAPGDWGVIAETPEWCLCVNQGGRNGWTALHLYSKVARPGKVSYWLSWHTHERRFARVHDQDRLHRYEPDLARWVHERMLEWTDLDAEICAEDLV